MKQNTIRTHTRTYFAICKSIAKGKNTPARFMLSREGFKCINLNRNNKRINGKRMGWAKKKRFLTKREYYFKFIEFDRPKFSFVELLVWFWKKDWNIDEPNSIPSLCLILHICIELMHRFHGHVKMLEKNYAILTFQSFFQSIFCLALNEFVTFFWKLYVSVFRV